MWTKLLPEAGGCNLMFLPEAAGGGQNFCRRLGSSMVGMTCAALGGRCRGGGGGGWGLARGWSGGFSSPA